MLLTRLADEQSANEPRVVVLHDVYVGDVGVGEASGVMLLWRNLRRHLPVVYVLAVGLHHVILFLLLRRVVEVVGPCKRKQSIRPEQQMNIFIMHQRKIKLERSN